MNIRGSFHSVLAPDLRRYIALKQVLGRSFDTSCRIFFQLDRFLCGLSKATDLTQEAFQKWFQTLESLSPNTRLVRMRAVRHFCLYRRRTVPDCFVPDPTQFPKARPVVRPYIFSNGDVAKYLTIVTICRDRPCAEPPLGWRLSCSTPPVFAGVNCCD
jgi:hypothetical protein